MSADRAAFPSPSVTGKLRVKEGYVKLVSKLAGFMLEDGTDQPVRGGLDPFSQRDLPQYLSAIRDMPVLSTVEEREMAWRIINDKCAVARDQMMRCNLRLVLAITNNYMNRGATIEELIESGNLGLAKAIDTFDPAMGTRFSTCATWWIKPAIRHLLSQNVSQHKDLF